MLKVYTIDDSEWDAIVKKFKNYDVYWLSGYVKAFKYHGDGEPILFYFEENNARAINIVMKRDISNDKKIGLSIPKNKYFDFATPYGYGGWLIEPNVDKERLFNEYNEWCINNNIVSEFVRFHPILKNNFFVEDYYEILPLGNTVAIDLSSFDDIWNNFSGKNRNVIRKAIKNNIKIYNSRNPKIFKTFKSIYNLTMDKDNATDYYYFDDDFYDSILNDLSYNSEIFYAQLDDKIIAASIMIFANGRMNYHLSGSLKEYQSLAPTNLLLYEAAKWGSANGYKTLHLGGGVGASEDSLLKFKKSFYKGELFNYYIGKKIFNNEIYNNLVNMRKKIDNENFFPKYRG